MSFGFVILCLLLGCDRYYQTITKKLAKGFVFVPVDKLLFGLNLTLRLSKMK